MIALERVVRGLVVHSPVRTQLVWWITAAAVAVAVAVCCSIHFSPGSQTIRELERSGAEIRTEFEGPEWLEEIKGSRRFLPWERVTSIGMEVDEFDCRQLDQALVHFPKLEFLVVKGTSRRVQGPTHLSSCRNLRFLGLY